MRRVLVLLMMILLLFSNMGVSTSETAQWWDDDFNFRLGIVVQDSAQPGYIDIELSDIVDQLGLYPLDPEWGYADGIDPESFRIVDQGASASLHEFNWASNNTYVVDDFDSTQTNWVISSQMETFVTVGQDGDSLKFYKNTETSVKMYATVNSDVFQDMDYLVLYGKGNFMVTLRDPAKGKYMVEEELRLSDYRMAVIPLSFVNFREGVDYYLELIPLDFTTVNEIDGINFIDDSIHMEFAPSENDLYLYFNTYLTGGSSEPVEMAEIDGNALKAEVTDPEGFRILYEEIPTEVSGTYVIKASILDVRNDLEWARYRVEYPSSVDLESTVYGVWGELEQAEGGLWTADWDTVGTVSDGHHTLTIAARDSEGNVMFQTIELEVDNIIGSDTDLSPGTEEYSFAVVGDVQPESGSEANPLVATYIMKCIAEGEDVDFIVQVGDVNYAGHLYEYYQVRDLVTAYAKVPFYCVVGNHDAAATDGLENFEYFFGELYYSFDYGNSHFIFLCTELDDQKGLITGGQLAWLEDELSSNTDKDHIFIAAHQPIYPVFHGIENQEEVQSLIEQYDNVTAIFQGHEHTYYHEVLDSGADNFVTGGGTWLDSQYLVENTFNHYFIITVTGDTMEWRLEKTSQLFVEDPLPDTYTNEASIDVSGHTQPYAEVDVNGTTVTAGYKGDFVANIQLEYGENTITVHTDDLPDGEGHTVSFTVIRQMPLEIGCPDTISDGEELSVTVTSLDGPVEGATVYVMNQTGLTDGDGIVVFDSYPEDGFRISASGDGYYGTYKTVDVEGASETSSDHTIALAVFVFILIGIAASLLKRK